jgi:hypothetical protein
MSADQTTVFANLIISLPPKHSIGTGEGVGTGRVVGAEVAMSDPGAKLSSDTPVDPRCLMPSLPSRTNAPLGACNAVWPVAVSSITGSLTPPLRLTKQGDCITSVAFSERAPGFVKPSSLAFRPCALRMVTPDCHQRKRLAGPKAMFRLWQNPLKSRARSCRRTPGHLDDRPAAPCA